MINRPKFFMGYEMIYDAAAMEYIIKDDCGNFVRAGEWQLKNDTEYMTSIVDVINTWQTSNPGATIASKAAKSKPDLHDVSTSDLLNEAFRRGAIKQMSMKRAVAGEMSKDPDYVEYLQRSIRQDALVGHMDDLEKHGVFNVGKNTFESQCPWEEVEYTVDYFICKHPLTLKKDEERAY